MTLTLYIWKFEYKRPTVKSAFSRQRTPWSPGSTKEAEAYTVMYGDCFAVTRRSPQTRNLVSVPVEARAIYIYIKHCIEN
jgi:hypothetical protein